MTTLDDIRTTAAAGESETVEFKATTAELDRARPNDCRDGRPVGLIVLAEARR